MTLKAYAASSEEIEYLRKRKEAGRIRLRFIGPIFLCVMAVLVIIQCLNGSVLSACLSVGEAALLVLATYLSGTVDNWRDIVRATFEAEVDLSSITFKVGFGGESPQPFEVTRWRRVRDVAFEGGDAVLALKTGDRKVIPARAFANDEHRAMFLDLSRRAMSR